MKREKRAIEEIKGTGILDDRLGSRRMIVHQIIVEQEFMAGNIPGLKSAYGSFHLDGSSGPVAVGRFMKIELADGRSAKITVTKTRGTSHEFSVTGPIE